MKSVARITVLLSALLLPTACATHGASSADSKRRAILQQSCTVRADCPTGFECEVEVEHGTASSFCQADDAAGACPAGYELEVEHGQSLCKPHGGGGRSDDRGSGDDRGGGGRDDHGGGSGSGSGSGDDHGGGSGSGSGSGSGDDHGGGGSGSGSGGAGATCATDMDCPSGQECEIEVEHGTTTSRCKAHGG